ncbi:MAG: ABC transporter permease [Thermoanaerobaculum sp.]
MGFFREVWVHRRLVLTLAGRAVKARYAGSVLGLAWAILEPLLQFALFLLVFGVFLGLRGLAPAGTSFALWLLAGLIPFLLLQEGWVRAAGVFRAHAGLVKHVPVPLSVLLASELLAVLARHAVTLTVLVMVAGGMGQLQPSRLPFFLGGVVLALVFLLGGSLWLATAGAYLPDMVPVTSTVMGFLLYLTPILYPLSVVPERWRQLAALNPLFGVVEILRCFLVGGNVSLAAAVSCGVAALLLLGGLAFFLRRKNYVRDLV